MSGARPRLAVFDSARFRAGGDGRGLNIVLGGKGGRTTINYVGGQGAAADFRMVGDIDFSVSH